LTTVFLVTSLTDDYKKLILLNVINNEKYTHCTGTATAVMVLVLAMLYCQSTIIGGLA